MYCVYVIYNKDANKIYIGQTDNLCRRIKEHNDPEQNKNHYTAKFVGQWELIYQEEAETRSAAIAREKELKSHKGRDFLKEYIPG